MRNRQPSAFDTVFATSVGWRGLAPRGRVVWGVTATLVAAIPSVLVVSVGGVASGAVGAAVGLLISGSLIAVLWWLVGRRYRAWGYGFGDDELVIRRGVLVRRLTIVPVGRMQFIDVRQGPLERWLGLATVQLHTAAAASNARVPMLTVADAGRLRDELTARGAGRSGGT